MRPKIKKLQVGEQWVRVVAMEVSSEEDMWGVVAFDVAA